MSVRPINALLRFKLKVWPRGDCWEFRGKTNNDSGYPLAQFFRKWEYAHRHAYEIAKGPLPDSRRVVVDHICGHRWCVRPSHLEAVTASENVRRAIRRAGPRARRTVCPHGHPMLGDNVIIVVSEHRRCRSCQNEKSRKFQANKRRK